MVSFSKLLQSNRVKLLIALFVLAIAAVPVLPNYVTQRWSWRSPPEVPGLELLRALEQQGLAVSGWESRDQQEVEISGHTWSLQTLAAPQPDAPPVLLLLRPQTWHRDQPQVEWMDINGIQHWTVDRRQPLRFTAPTQPPTQVTARFLRGWNQQQTYAVLQWYAWSTGGSPAPSRWFWADQRAQWRDRQRMPWVAVCLMIPIKPLGEIEPVRSLAESLGQRVQTALIEQALRSSQLGDERGGGAEP